MPNWVMNTLTLEGDKELIAEVGARLRAPIPHREDDDQDHEFSFWNIIKPDDSIMEEYEGKNDFNNTSPNNWYHWNVRNWGCKWDARVTNSEITEDTLCYYFDTPWSPPMNALETLSAQYPTLQIQIRYIEEQGWGGVVHFYGGEGKIEDEWDIPESHEEYEKAWDGDCYRCEQGEDLFQDCPAAIASQSHFTDIELLGECRWCEINEDGRYDDCPPNE